MGKSITTYLITGKANGPYYCQLSNSNCRFIFVPRENLDVLSREDFQTPAFYILANDDNEIYIGETENFNERVKSHCATKSFWTKALIFTSIDNSLTKADVKYIECLALSATLNPNYTCTENKKASNKPNIPEWQKDSDDVFFEEIKYILSWLEYKLFEIPEKTITDKVKESVTTFKLKRSYCDASMQVAKAGYIVKSGSKIRKGNTNSCPNIKDRNNLISLYCTDCKLNQDIVFDSCSAASTFVMGASSNGWVEWKDDFGKTLSDIFRTN